MRLLPEGKSSEIRETRDKNSWIFALILGLITLVELVYAYRHSDFNNDDLEHFILATKSNLLAYMATPVETIHIVPFHRLLTFIIYHLAPMNFPVALALLGCIHAVTLYYLCRISRLLQAGFFGDIIILFYALNILNIHLFVWWSSAAHRIPYLALSACAAYHYLVYLKNNAWQDAMMVFIAFVLGCGFYVKMVMTPFYLLVYGLAAFGFSKEAWREVIKIPVLLAVVSVFYTLTYEHYVHPVHAGLLLSLKMTALYMAALLGNLSGVTLEAQVIQQGGLLNVAIIMVACLWLIAIFFTGWRNKPVVLCWLAVMGVVFLDFFPIARSDRSIHYPDIVPYSVRYHADALVIIAVMLLIIASKSVRHGIAKKYRLILTASAVSIYAGAMVANLSSDVAKRQLMFSTFSHMYLHHMRKDLKGIHDPHPSFAVTPVPVGLDWAVKMTSDRLVPLFVPGAKFDPSRGDYRLLDDGHIVANGPK